jgi:arylsulfatase A-like enzyme
VFILIDDLGWKDLGCYGSTFYETPNIDGLASDGMRFTSAYAACPVCSPTRASILTGKYPARLHLTDWIPGHKRPRAKLRVPEFNQELPLEEVTIAEVLKNAGYVSGSIGKWHLARPPGAMGEGKAVFPGDQGFDFSFGGDHRGHPPSYFYPYGILNISSGVKGEYLTDRLTDEAEAFIEKNKEKPFFLYLCQYGVHTPLQAKAEMVARYKKKAKTGEGQRNPVYAAMIQSVDESVGRIMRKLDEVKIANRTVIVFTSDNGGLIPVTSNAPLRAGKGTLYEGGIRVPMIVRWPEAVNAKSTCDVPVASVDFHGSILEIAGVEGVPGDVVDGVSIGSLLKQTGRVNRDAIYWHYPHYHPGGATPCGAVREGDFKLIEFYEDGHLELYNLREDLSETNDVASKMPEKAAELRQKLADWRRAVNAQMPTPNPDYKQKKAS